MNKTQNKNWKQTKKFPFFSDFEMKIKYFFFFDLTRTCCMSELRRIRPSRRKRRGTKTVEEATSQSQLMRIQRMCNSNSYPDPLYFSIFYFSFCSF